jgi:hypothetical protein
MAYVPEIAVVSNEVHYPVVTWIADILVICAITIVAEKTGERLV